MYLYFDSLSRDNCLSVCYLVVLSLVCMETNKNLSYVR